MNHISCQVHITQSILQLFCIAVLPLTLFCTNIVRIDIILTINNFLLINQFCFRPDLEDDQAWFQFFMVNFERHYLGTRAPFDLSVPEAYIASYPAVYRALDRFIEFMTRLPDVFMVSSGIIKIRYETS